MGAFTASRAWREWPGASQLDPSDRVRVARAVRRGEAINDPRLAPAVFDYGQVTRQAQQRQRRYAWVLWIFALGTLAFAIGATARASYSEALVWWLLVGFWVVMLAWLPARRARLLASARRAEESAGALSPSSSERHPPTEGPGAVAAPGEPLPAWSLPIALLALLLCFVVSFGLTVLELVLLVGVVVGFRWKRTPSRQRPALVLIWVAAVLIVVRLVIPSTVVRTVAIRSAAMEPTIAKRDRVMFNRVGGFGIGDVVAFHAPKDAHRRLCGPTPHMVTPGSAACDSPEYDQKKGFYIRRIVAGPGDVISIVDGELTRNGVPERASYVTPCSESQCDFPTPIKVPPGMWFVMADNRRESDDSRFFGPIPGSWIIGAAIMRTWPPGHVGTL